MTAARSPWPFGAPPYHKTCGGCGFRYLAQTVDAYPPLHFCKPPEPLCTSPNGFTVNGGGENEHGDANAN